MTSYLREHFDFVTAGAAVALMTIGLISIYSATYDAHASDVATKQLAFVGVGLVVLAIVTFLPFKLLQFISYPSYFLSILLLVSVLILGKTVSGSTSWFNLGAFRLQPSEFTKITTALALATYISRTDVNLQRFNNLAVACGIVILPVILILLQPDTGTTMIYAGMFIPVLYWGGATKFTLLSVVAPVAAAVAALFGITPFFITVMIMGVLIYMTKENRILAAVVFSATVLIGISVQFIYEGLKPYQQKRIATFLDPNADPLGAGYNVLQSKVAIGSGGLFGKGFLHGSQTQLNFIPEQWTDFIFCVIGEEFGFVGAAVVLGLFLTLLVRGVRLGATVKNRYGSTLAIAISAIFAIHVLMNVGMSVGLLPVVGVPLPFLSYGGSALLTNITMVGILLNLHAHRKEY